MVQVHSLYTFQKYKINLVCISEFIYIYNGASTFKFGKEASALKTI